MLTVIRDEQGHLQAACELTPVNEQGHPTNPQDGAQWLWVHQLELSHGVESRRILRELIAIISLQAPWALGAYWHRTDRTGTRQHLYTRTQLLTMVGKEGCPHGQ